MCELGCINSRRFGERFEEIGKRKMIGKGFSHVRNWSLILYLETEIMILNAFKWNIQEGLQAWRAKVNSNCLEGILKATLWGQMMGNKTGDGDNRIERVQWGSELLIHTERNTLFVKINFVNRPNSLIINTYKAIANLKGAKEGLLKTWQSTFVGVRREFSKRKNQHYLGGFLLKVMRLFRNEFFQRRASKPLKLLNLNDSQWLYKIGFWEILCTSKKKF